MLVVFLTLEPSDSKGDVSGVDLNVALDACHIIVNNQPGFLSTSKDKEGKVSCPLEGAELLSHGIYWYFLDDVSIPERYPIVPSFEEWAFPHGKVPARWNIFDSQSSNSINNNAGSSASMSDRVKTRDVTCIISKHSVVLENARLIPKSQVAWFNRVNMRNYIDWLDPHDPWDNIRNGIALNAELRGALNKGYYVMCPKGGRPAVHFIKRGREMQRDYHAREVHFPPNMAKEFWYARFAYNIFLSLPKNALVDVSFVNMNGTLSIGTGKLSSKTNSAVNPGSRPGSAGGHVSMPPPDTGAPEEIDATKEMMDDLYNQQRNMPWMIHEIDDEDPSILPLDPNQASRYETITWYPGIRQVIRMKEKWFEDHPEIRQISNPSEIKADDGSDSEYNV